MTEHWLEGTKVLFLKSFIFVFFHKCKGVFIKKENSTKIVTVPAFWLSASEFWLTAIIVAISEELTEGSTCQILPPVLPRSVELETAMICMVSPFRVAN